MSRAPDFDDLPESLQVTDLFRRYLQRQVSAHQHGIGQKAMQGEVEPYDAVPLQAIDPQLAWEEALTAARYFPGEPAFSQQPPPDWPTLVVSHEPVLSLPFCLGNFPQIVRPFHDLLRIRKITEDRLSGDRMGNPIVISHWADEVGRSYHRPEALLAAAVLRLARQFQRAAEVLEHQRRLLPASLRPLWANEEAALSWQSGRFSDAIQSWKTQPESVPVLFNRGMAALFTDEPKEARNCLLSAVAQLPESGAWHHLGQLYLALVGLR